MSPSPQDSSNASRVDSYGASWAAIMQLVRDGHSWSGRERNCCYLNEGSGRFSDVSTLSGLDVPDDGRALAIVDWDQDGDLDLWFRNRTAPRLRLMQNRQADLSTTDEKAAWLALRLRGTTSNRDGIGAVVEVVLDSVSSSSPKLVKSVRAGDLFLSQSSKWLHFGLGKAARIASVRVIWPGGDEEVFKGLSSNQRFILQQGKGIATTWKPKAAASSGSAAAASLVALPGKTSSARVVLPRRVPFPALAYRQAAKSTLSPPAKARALLLWTSSCPHCLREMAELSEALPALHAAGIDVLALCTDTMDSTSSLANSPALEAINKTGFAHAWGFLDQASAGRISEFQRALFDTNVAMSVPLTVLLDANSQVMAIYRGSVTSETLIDDARQLLAADETKLHHIATPFVGRWFTNPVGTEAMAEFMARRFEERLPEESLPYLELAVESSNGQKQLQLRRELANKQLFYARQYAKAEQPAKAAPYFEAALRTTPGVAEVHYEFGVLLGTYGKLQDAEKQFEAVLRIDPSSGPAKESLQLIRSLMREAADEK